MQKLFFKKVSAKYFILEIKLLFEVRLKLCDGEADLLHGITLTDSYAAVLNGVEVVCNAEGSTDLVLSAVTLTDRACLVEVNAEVLCKLCIYLFSALGELL